MKQQQYSFLRRLRSKKLWWLFLPEYMKGSEVLLQPAARKFPNCIAMYLWGKFPAIFLKRQPFNHIEINHNLNHAMEEYMGDIPHQTTNLLVCSPVPSVTGDIQGKFVISQEKKKRLCTMLYPELFGVTLLYVQCLCFSMKCDFGKIKKKKNPHKNVWSTS